MNRESSDHPTGDDVEKVDVKTDILIDLSEDPTDATENVSCASETASLSPLVDLHACGICFQLYNNSDRLPKVLSCGHTNCLACLNSWVKHGSSYFPVCATCRKITHKPVYLLPNNFQLLEVLRRMRLISVNSPPTLPEEPQNSSPATETNSSEARAVCEQIDGHMNDIASLLESQMERLRINQQHPSATADHGFSLHVVEKSVAEFLQHWESTKSCLLSSLERKPFLGESAILTDMLDIMYPHGMFDEFDLTYDGLIGGGSQLRSYSPEFPGRDGSDTLPEHSYSDFSLFESDGRETAVSVSLSSSLDENFSGFDENVDTPIFPDISTIDSQSYCTLCQCQIPRSYSNYRTHVLGRRHQLNGAIERTTASIASGRGRSNNTHPSRRQTRRTQMGASASRRNTGGGSTPNLISTPVIVRDGLANPSEIPDWLRRARQENSVIEDDGTSLRDRAQTFVGNANDRSFGRRTQSETTTEWRYGRNSDNPSHRIYSNTQRRNRGGVQSDRGNNEAATYRRGNQRPQPSNHGGNSQSGGVGRVSDGSYNSLQAHHRFSANDPRRLNPSDDRRGVFLTPTWDRFIRNRLL
ncbi:hypothetical protein KIN20_033989 [Parelaphostrongylus tenuis]|uniref:RING-type domain-containing protein n=1 Tax=Parelaphostrongylus tenuis TaxID=148309 RepID=A0AAD5R963_PARTN|nr:hypothetical protein KIN20_033989 [Parelaphostrongylus tenuis]